MPVQPCEQDGKPGYRWGETGACYVYTAGNEQSRAAAEEKASAQGRAIKAREGASFQIEDEPTYAMVALILPADIATALALESEGAEPADVLHVTLVYLGPDATAELDRAAVEAAIAPVVAEFPRINGTYNGIGHFGPEGEGRAPDEGGRIPIVTTLDAPGLAALREALVSALREAVDYPADTHGFCPHTTLAYVPAEGHDHESMPEPSMLDVVFDEVWLCWGDYVGKPENATRFPLGGEAVVAAAELQEMSEPMELAAPSWRMLAVNESRPTDDGRAFRAEGVLTWREPPLAVTWTAEITDGHLGAELGASADRIERQGPEIWLYGSFTQDEAGAQLLEHVQAGHPLFPSVSIGDEIAVLEVDEQGRELIVFEQGKIVGVTLLPEQSQEGTFIELDQEPVPALAACAAPKLPSRSLFDPMTFERPTPTIVDGRHVFGHVAGPGCHIGVLDRCVKVSTTSKDFTLFHKGITGDGGGIETAEGDRIRVGQITLVGGHADLHLAADAARRHYDDTRSAVADVVVRWDEDNDLPYFTGALRPGVTDEQIQVLRASGVSGDWRPIEGEHRLVALPAVNVPGFPVRVRALVAAGEMQAFIGRITPVEEEDMDEMKFQEMHERLHSPEHQRADATNRAFAAFQQGNIQALIDHICSTATSMTECMEIVEGHVDDPGALCNWMRQQCGGEFGAEGEAMTASAWQLALEGLDQRVWGPELAKLDREVGIR